MTEEGRERGLMVLPFVLAALRLRETMEAGSPAYRVSSDAGRPPRWGTELRRGKKRDSSDPRRRSSREGDEPNLGRGAARDDRLAVIFASEVEHRREASCRTPPCLAKSKGRPYEAQQHQPSFLSPPTTIGTTSTDITEDQGPPSSLKANATAIGNSPVYAQPSNVSSEDSLTRTA